MKIVIEISEKDYNNIEPFLNGATIKGGFNLFKTLEIIKNGIPLDKIRAEIDRQHKWLARAGYTPYNVDIAFDAIKTVLKGANE